MITPERRAKKRSEWIRRTQRLYEATGGIDEPTVVSLLSRQRQQSIRINTLRASAEQVIHDLAKAGVKLRPFEWCSEGYEVVTGGDVLRDHALTREGSIYIQNAASWLPVLALNATAGDRVLDVCAAPGGKTSHIAQRAQGNACITANDNSRARLMRLQANMKRLGADKTITYTLYDATQLSRRLEGQLFSHIVLDAPCSGEGMMSLSDESTLETWSVAHIKRLQQLQKRVITEAWRLLESGGTLVYSTCTMAPEENEAVIDYILRKNDDARIEPLPAMLYSLANRIPSVQTWNAKQFAPDIEKTLRLAPGKTIEAFYVAKLKKR